MPGGSVTPVKLPVRWTTVAKLAFDKTWEHIAAQDATAAALVDKRLSAALDVIALQPGIGTLTRRHNVRRFPIPKTGHMIEYRHTGDEITVIRWIRQSRVRALSIKFSGQKLP
jgi:plasmid stabilization system protein ParE